MSNMSLRERGEFERRRSQYKADMEEIEEWDLENDAIEEWNKRANPSLE